MAKIVEIYREYRVPPPVQLHMLRVGGLADLILDHWNGPPVGRTGLIRVLLTHDMGNIVKMNLEEDLAGDVRLSPDGIELLKTTQIEMRVRFGSDDQLAARVLAQEVGLSKEELLLLEAKHLSKNVETVASDDYGRKIGAYADQRVAPKGVVALAARFTELRERYRDRPHSPHQQCFC